MNFMMVHTTAIIIVMYPTIINSSESGQCRIPEKLPIRKAKYPASRRIKGHLKKCSGLI